MLNQTLTGSEQIALVEGTEVFEPHPDVSASQLENCKFAVLDNDRIVSGLFGRLVQFAPNGFAKSYPSKDALMKDLALFRRLQDETESTPQIQAPQMIPGYFSFDGNAWHLLISFQYAMIGETDTMKYLGGIVNPEAYFGKDSALVAQAVSKDVSVKLDMNASFFADPVIMERIGDLFYDSLATFLLVASKRVRNEEARKCLDVAGRRIWIAWSICMSHMKGVVNPKHSNTIRETNTDAVGLGNAAGSLSGFELQTFLLRLSEKIARDGQADADRGRQRLSTELFRASLAIYEAAKALDPIR